MENRLRNVKFMKPLVIGTYSFLLTQQEKRKYGNMTHKWTCLLRCPNSTDISIIISKVIFDLDPSFMYPRRVFVQAPFEVNEVGWGEFFLQVKIYFADSTLPPISFMHFVKLNTDRDQSHSHCVVNETYEEVIFRNPTISFYEKLLECNRSHVMPHKYQEYFIKYDVKEDLCIRDYLNAQSKIQTEIRSLMAEATELSHDITTSQQHYFIMKNELGVSSDEN